MYQFASQSDRAQGEVDPAQTHSVQGDHERREHRGWSLPAKTPPLNLRRSSQVRTALEVRQRVTGSPRVIAQAKVVALTRRTPVQRTAGGYAMPLPASLTNFNTSSGRSLPETVREKMESFFDTSFADVRIHTGPAAESIGALAFTHGSNLHFAPGMFLPSTRHGVQLLAHELAHVIQQRQGRVRSPCNSHYSIVEDRALENEADLAGSRAATRIVSSQADRPGLSPIVSATSSTSHEGLPPPARSAPPAGAEQSLRQAVSGNIAIQRYICKRCKKDTTYGHAPGCPDAPTSSAAPPPTAGGSSSVTVAANRPTTGGMVEGDATVLANQFGWSEVSANDFTCDDPKHTPNGKVYTNGNGAYYGADNTGHVGWGFKVWTKGKKRNQLIYKGNLVWDGANWEHLKRGTK